VRLLLPCLGLLALTPRAEAGDSATPPTITSPTKASITATTATLGGNITSPGSVALATRGIVYALTSVNPNPTVGGAGVTFRSENTSSTGVFTLPATGLTAGANYSYKAYALNLGSQEAYSAVDTFDTISASGTIHPLKDGNPRSVLGTGGAPNAVRGWRFKANTAVSVTELGSDNPLASGEAFNVVLWDVASQTQLAKQDFTSNGLDAWQWQSLTTPVLLTSGKEYIVCLYSTTSGYYFGSGGGSAWHPTGDIEYLDMRYANGATADT
jgi:hypothetical protein